MNTLDFTSTSTELGITERDFMLGQVPGTLWSPANAVGPAPLVLLCHGGGRDRKAPAMSGRAALLATGVGMHSVALDAPGHGARPLSETDKRERELLARAQHAGDPVGPIVERYNADIARRALPEWRAVLDALQWLPEIGRDASVGWFGLNMGTAIGVPLLAVEPRITAAVLGVFWPGSVVDAARTITIPIEFVMQWDDENIPRGSALELFDAFGSAEKTLHANAGRHKDVPRFESDSAVRFFARHLTGTGAG